MYSPEELDEALKANRGLFDWLAREGSALLDDPGFQVCVGEVVRTLKQEEKKMDEEIADSLSPEEQQELYEFMHNTLGLRIYK